MRIKADPQANRKALTNYIPLPMTGNSDAEYYYRKGYTNPNLKKWYAQFLKGRVGQEVKVRIKLKSKTVINGPCKSTSRGNVILPASY